MTANALKKIRFLFLVLIDPIMSCLPVIKFIIKSSLVYIPDHWRFSLLFWEPSDLAVVLSADLASSGLADALFLTRTLPVFDQYMTII